MKYPTALFALAAAIPLLGCHSGVVAPSKSAQDKPQETAAANGTSSGGAMDEIDEYLEEEGEKPAARSDTKKEGATAAGPAAASEDSGKELAAERKEEIRKLVKSKRESVSNCYKMAKEKNPTLGSRVAITFLLKPDGKLKSDPEVAANRSDITDPAVIKCAIDVIKSIDFPPHPKGMETTFTYPFGF